MKRQGHSSRPPDPAVRIRDLSYQIHGSVVLDALSLDLDSGEVLAIAGINGAGKTTLLRCLLDFCRADRGNIELFGVNSRLTAAREQVYYLPERFIPSPVLRGEEVLRMLAGLHRQAPTRAELIEASGLVGLDPTVLNRRCSEYSKGMAQKIGLAAALLSRQPLLVLDEPMSGLDPRARAQFGDLIRSLQQAGTSILLSSHSPSDCARIADRIAILDQGRWRFVGSPQMLRDTQPNGDLEAAFIECLE